MKKNILLLIAAFLFSYSLQAGDGTENNPFTVAEAIEKNDQAKQYYVKGFVVGEMENYSGGKHIYELAPSFAGTTALLIADNIDEIDLSKCLNIQLGQLYTDNFNLDWNPQVWRKEVVVCGYLKRYMEMPGVKDISHLEVTSLEPLEDETLFWSFLEDMNSKNYTPNSSINTFAGGTYVGETGTWTFTGATLGDTGKDQKFGRAAARIRLTEGSTGDAGYIQMEEDKPSGVGTIRFWAANYEEDSSGGALVLHISTDQGNSWEKVSNSITITKTWKEYQFYIKRDGSIRLRISKDETGSKGINVDNIRISDYIDDGGEQPGTGLCDNGVSDLLSCYTVENGLNITSNKNNLALNIFNISGQIVYTNILNEGINFIPLSNGIYIINIGIFNQKVIINC